MLSEEFLKKMKARLEEEKTQVTAKIKSFTTPEQPSDDIDDDDLGHDATEDILQDSLAKTHEEILEKINFALERIEKGTYGQCLKCQKEIAEEDLVKLPWAEHCSHCGQEINS